jgi:hypothetical protein
VARRRPREDCMPAPRHHRDAAPARARARGWFLVDAASVWCLLVLKPGVSARWVAVHERVARLVLRGGVFLFWVVDQALV